MWPIQYPSPIEMETHAISTPTKKTSVLIWRGHFDIQYKNINIKVLYKGENACFEIKISN